MPNPFRVVAPAALVLAGAAPVLWADPALAQDVVVNGSSRTELLDCNHGDAVVNGSSNRLVFHGLCRSLQVNGSGNAVQIDLMPGGQLAIAGSGNRITYNPIVPGPVLTAEGSGNLVGAGTGGNITAELPPSPPSQPPAVVAPPPTAEPGTLVLTGDNQKRNIDCAGRDVLIEGSDGTFILRGGCRSVNVQGQDDSIDAVLLPGARLTIGGQGVTLHYTMASAGPPPVVSVTGAGSQALLTSPSGTTITTRPGSTTAVIGGAAQ